jgi:hypothetical protein
MTGTIAKRYAGPVVAAVLMLLTGIAAADRVPDAESARDLATRFQLAPPVTLYAVPGYPVKNVRAVHPSLARISGWVSSFGASAALGDVDGTGLSKDLCLVDPRTDLVTLQPVPGTPGKDGEPRYETIVLDPHPLPYDPATMAPMGCMFAGLKEDGYLDVVVYFWGRTPIAFLQIPSTPGTKLRRESFKAVELVDTPERWFTNAATTADFDGSGHVSLLFANYFPDGADILNANGSGVNSMHNTMSRSFTGGRKHFLLWKSASSGPDPEVNLRHVVPLGDSEIGRGWTLAVGAADLEGNLLPDLYLANDFGPDRLLRNRSTPGHLAFELVEGEGGFFIPKSAVLGHDSFKGMGVDFADVDNNGLLDFFVSNIAAPYSLNESHMMWMNTGDKEAWDRGVAPFVQKSEPMGLSRSGWGWDAKFVDLDNSGRVQLLQATGFLKGDVNRWPELQSLATSNDQIMSHPEYWPSFRLGDDLSGHQPNPIFARVSSSRFVNIASELGLDAPYVTRGIAVADVDGFGALSFVYANQWEDSVYIHNECVDCGAFLGLHLLRQRDPAAPTIVTAGHPEGVRLPHAIGATVLATTPDGRRFATQVDGGNGHSGRRSPDIHIGFGNIPRETIIDLEIKWRTLAGEVRTTKLQVQPGWHTVLLGL